MQDTVADRKDVAPLRWVLFVLVIAVFGALFYDSFAYLVNMWATEDMYSQGWLIAVVSIFFAVTAVFGRGIEVGPPRWRYAPIVFALGVIWALAYLTQTVLLQLLVLPVLFWFCVLCCLGTRVARLWLFPAAYFFLALPFWSILTPILQSLTVDVTVFIVRLWGIPMHVVGNFVTIPAGRFEIVSGCSGTHQFAVAVAFTWLAAKIGHKNLLQQGIIVAGGLMLALIANWIRVATLVIVGQTSNMQSYLIQNEHVSFGWGLFVLLVVIPVILMSRTMNRPAIPKSDPVQNPGTADRRAWQPIGTTAIVVLAIAAGPLLARSAMATGDGDPRPLALPVIAGGWSGPFENHPDWVPWFAGADSIAAASYRRDKESVDLFVLSYYNESQGRELINQSNIIADPRSWRFRSRGSGRLAQPAGRPFTWSEIEVSSASGRSRVIRYWYDIAGRQTHRPLVGKVFQAWARLGGKPRASLVAISAVCDTDCDRAMAALDDFLSVGELQLLDLDVDQTMDTNR